MSKHSCTPQADPDWRYAAICLEWRKQKMETERNMVKFLITKGWNLHWSHWNLNRKQVHTLDKCWIIRIMRQQVVTYSPFNKATCLVHLLWRCNEVYRVCFATCISDSRVANCSVPSLRVSGTLPTWRETRTRACWSATCSDVILLLQPSPQVSTKSAPRWVSLLLPPPHEWAYLLLWN